MDIVTRPKANIKTTKTEEGKFIVEFDSVPKLLFVSPEGYGSNDALYVDGREVNGARDVTINSPFCDITTHSISYLTLACENKGS